MDVVQFLEEPAVYFCQLMDFLDGVSLLHGFGNDENSFVGGFLQCLVDIVDAEFLVVDVAVHSLANHAESLLDDFLERAADSHDFADGLHARPQHAVDAAELA